MQVPPSQQPPFVPPPGYRPAPQKSGVPVWVWIIVGLVGLCIIVPAVLAGIGVVSLNNASKSLANSSEKMTNTTVSKTAELPEGWTRATAANVSIGMAPGWKPIDLTGGQLNDVLDRGMQNDPELQRLGPTVKQMAANKSYKLFLFHKPTEAAPKFATNINVLAVPMPSGSTMEEVSKGAESEAGRIAKGTVQRETAQLPDGEATLLRYDLSVSTAGGEMMASTRSYFIEKGGTVYGITVMIPKVDEAALGPETEQMVKTFSIH